MNASTIGIAGLGRMGSAMAKRLLDTGHKVVVWNRSVAKAAPLQQAGAHVAPSPAALVQDADVVISMVFDGAALQAVFEGPDGLLVADCAGKLFIEMSTVRPGEHEALAALVQARGGAFIECPVGGTVGPAASGKLLGLAGGTTADLERARPILDVLCRRVEHAGPVGAGARLKLAINLPLLVFWQAMGEAAALCGQLGLDHEQLVDVFADSSGGPNVLKMRGAVVAAALGGAPPGPAAFDCDQLRKDLRTMVAEARDRGFSLPLAERTLAVFDEASQAGWGSRDGTELPAYWTAAHVKGGPA